MEKKAFDPLKRKYKRKLTDRALQTVNPNRVLEKVFNPEVTEIMDKLDEVDDNIRETIEKVYPDDLLKEVKSNVYKMEYLIAIAELNTFHDAMKKIYDSLYDFNAFYQDKVHNKFYFEGMNKNEKAKEKLKLLQQKFDKVVADMQSEEIKKEASNFITDFWDRHVSQRGRALKIWEKRFPEEFKAKKESLRLIIEKSETLSDFIYEALKELSVFRRKREIEDYVKKINEIKTKYLEYNKEFIKFYNNTAKAFIEQFNRFNEKQEAAQGIVQDPFPQQAITPEDKAKQVAKIKPTIYTDDAGKKHRLDGPAVAYQDRGGAWYYHGQLIGMSSVKYLNNDKLVASYLAKIKELEDARLAKLDKSNKKPAPRQMSKTLDQTEIPLGKTLPPAESVPPTVNDAPTTVSPFNDEKTKVNGPTQLSLFDDEKTKVDEPTQLSLFDDEKTKRGYNNFINELEIFADEDQSFLISRIAKYATKIQHQSPETALRLINIIDNLSE
jgi:hypothetical protein